MLTLVQLQFFLLLDPVAVPLASFLFGFGFKRTMDFMFFINPSSLSFPCFEHVFESVRFLLSLYSEPNYICHL